MSLNAWDQMQRAMNNKIINRIEQVKKSNRSDVQQNFSTKSWGLQYTNQS